MRRRKEDRTASSASALNHQGCGCPTPASPPTAIFSRSLAYGPRCRLAVIGRHAVLRAGWSSLRIAVGRLQKFGYDGPTSRSTSTWQQDTIQQHSALPSHLHIHRSPSCSPSPWPEPPATMSTIGFRFEEDRIIPPPRRSLLQRLNEKQGALVAHIRLNRNEEQVHRRPRLRALSSPSTLTVSSATPSYSSATTDKDSDFQDQSTSSPNGSTEDFSVPYQYARMPKDRESRQKIVYGMQNFIIWKQASCESDLARSFHNSPPQTPQSSHSWSSLSSASTEISDEQLEQWLERPVDADLHRSRKASAASSTASSTASISARPSMASIREECVELPKMTQDSRRKPLPSPPMEVLPEFIANAEKPLPAQPSDIILSTEGISKPLPLPTKLLKEISFQPCDSGSQPFRLSRHLLGDFEFNFNSFALAT